MKYNEEIQAQELYRILTEKFATSFPKVEISIEGKGVHWTCYAVCGNRRCLIAPLSVEYFVGFDIDNKTQATGRTQSQTEAIAASCKWVQGENLTALHEEFGFVDHHKRFLENFWRKSTEEYPELQKSATIRLDQQHSDFYYLWFVTENRSCRVSFFGQNQYPTGIFYWDDSHLFEILANDAISFSLIIKRWLCDNAKPSNLEQEFPWLDTGKLAHYFEEGKGIEGEFILSWDYTEQFYREKTRLPQIEEILKMIKDMRSRGYDKTLRAGQSMYTFILSKSRRNGLKGNQSSLAFDFQNNAMNISCYHAGNKENITLPRIEYTPQIDVLMKQLEAEKID